MLSKNKKMNGYLHWGCGYFEVHEQVGSLHNDFIPLMASANQHN
jgi:hypothetical protein